MTIQRLLTIPCVLNLHTAVQLDDYGDVITVVDTVDTVCELQQKERTEETVNADLQMTQWLVILPPLAMIMTGSDSVTIDGEEYQFIGDPQVMRNPRNRGRTHVEATAQKVV